MSGVTVKGLSIELGDFSLREINLQVRQGEYFSILGPTGAGKTVLLECIAGLRMPRTQGIWLNGTEVTHLPPEKRGGSYVPQDYALFPFLTAGENIAFGLKLRGFSSSEIQQRVESLSETLGIHHLLDRSPQTLSGGERQRVALARALIVEPLVLLLDEPLSALDPSTRSELRSELRRIHKAFSITTLHVTHDLEEAFVLSDRIAVLYEGRIQQTGTREEVFYSPCNCRVARFLDLRNVFKGELCRVQDDTVYISWKGHVIEAYAPSPSVLLHDSVSFCIRPEEIMIVRLGRSLRPGIKENMLSGQIVGEVPKGATHALLFRVNGSKAEHDLEIELPNHVYHRLNLAHEKQITVSLKKRAVHFLANGE